MRNEKGQFVKGARSERYKHGLSGGRFYKTYFDMRHRCENPTDKRFHRYGGRGIKVIWATFEDFRADMYESWVAHVKEYGQKQTQIDRIDRDGNYCKENCRWVTCSEQQRNRSTNRLITFEGKTLTSVEWGEITGIKAGEIRKRLYRGWPIEHVLTVPCIGVGKFKRKFHLHESIK